MRYKDLARFFDAMLTTFEDAQFNPTEQVTAINTYLSEYYGYSDWDKIEASHILELDTITDILDKLINNSTYNTTTIRELIEQAQDVVRVRM